MLPDKKKWHVIYLGLGSNLGDKDENLSHAIRNIEKRIGQVIASSAFYVTDPVGFKSDNQFLNAACEVRTTLQPLELLGATQAIEKDMGRTAKSQDYVYEDRVIDIDILLYDHLTADYPQLTLPHPHIQDRAFVLLPLAEIAPDYIHPTLRKSINDLKKELLA